MILKTRIKSVTTLATSSYIQETTYSTPTESKKREAQYSSPLTHSLLFYKTHTVYLTYILPSTHRKARCLRFQITHLRQHSKRTTSNKSNHSKTGRTECPYWRSSLCSGLISLPENSIKQPFSASEGIANQ